jgi:hypothetical protein
MSFNWKVTGMLKNSDGGVYSAHIHCSKAETMDGVDQVADFAYVLTFEPDSTSANFIPYESLTEEIVLGWAHNGDSESKAEEDWILEVDDLGYPTMATYDNYSHGNADPKAYVEMIVEGELAEIRTATAPAVLPW